MKNEWRVKIGRKHYETILDYCRYKGINIKNFNEPVTINPNCNNLSYLFNNCKSFNQPVVIPEGVINCSCMFRGCSNFNQPITIPTTVSHTVCMFTECTNFNSPITLTPRPNKRKYFCASRMFTNCKSFNQNIQGIVDYGKYHINNIVNDCTSFNQPFTLYKKINKGIFDYYKNNMYNDLGDLINVDNIGIYHWYDFDKNYLNFYLYDIILLDRNENIYITCKENNKSIKLNNFKYYSALLNLKNKLINFKDLKIEKNNNGYIDIEIPVTTEEFAKIALEVLLTD